MKLHIVAVPGAPRPTGYVHTEELIRRAALALGWDVRLADRPDYDWPDVLLFTHAWTEPTPPCRPVKVQWWFDLLWTEPDKPLERQRRWHPGVMLSMDLVLMKERSHLDRCRAEGIHARYMDQACWPPLYIGPLPEPHRPCDIAFAGQCHAHGGRRDIIRALGERFNVHVWSHDQRWRDFPVTLRPAAYGPAFLQIVADAKIHLNVGWRNDLDGCWSSRVWEVLGAGGLLVSQSVPGLDAVLPRAHLFDGPADAVAVCQEWLELPGVREAEAADLQAHAWHHHTYCHRLLRLEALCSAL